MQPCSRQYLGCDGTVGDKSEYEECSKCRSHVKRWKGAKPDHVRRRKANLQLWDGRISLHPALHKDKEKKNANGNGSHSKVTAIPLRANSASTTTTQVRKRA